MLLCLTMEKSKFFGGYSEIRVGFEDRSKSYSFNGPSGKVDDFEGSGNPELKRRKRVAEYNMYSMEGKLKSSLRNSFKWIKSKFRDDYFDMEREINPPRPSSIFSTQRNQGECPDGPTRFRVFY